MRDTRQLPTGGFRDLKVSRFRRTSGRPSELLGMPALPLGICVARDPRRRSDFYDARPAALALQLIKHRPANLSAVAPLGDRPSSNVGRNIALNAHIFSNKNRWTGLAKKRTAQAGTKQQHSIVMGLRGRR